jgi:hypothetical protein
MKKNGGGANTGWLVFSFQFEENLDWESEREGGWNAAERREKAFESEEICFERSAMEVLGVLIKSEDDGNLLQTNKGNYQVVLMGEN